MEKLAFHHEQAIFRTPYMTVPARSDINVYDSLDERRACEHFLGKTVEQAEALFRENSLYYQEDLMWMGPVAFCYYVHAAINYIRSEAATGDSAIISCLASLLAFRLEHQSPQLKPVAQPLAAVCGYILEHYHRFDLTPEIFGSLRGQLDALRQTFLQMCQSPASGPKTG